MTSLQQQLLIDGADCAHCPMGRHGQPGRPIATEYFGASTPLVALIGESPNIREVQNGRPFVGRSGALLDYACKLGGVPRRSLAILNAAACGPIPHSNDTMKAAAVAACRPRLLTELRRLQPKVLLAIGGSALHTLSPAGHAGVTALRGALLPLADDVRINAQFTSTLHPAHILRGGDGEETGPNGETSSAVDLLFYFFLYDLVKTYRLAKGQDVPWRDDCDLFVTVDGQIYRSIDGKPAPSDAVALELAAERLCADAAITGEVAIDVETDGKDALACGLTAIGFATTLGALSATWKAWQAAPNALATVRLLVTKKTIKTVYHNKPFDMSVLPRFGFAIYIPNAHCTLLQHHAAFPGLPHKLDQISTQFFIVPPWKSEFRRGEKDENSLVLYNSRDAQATVRLRAPLAKIVALHKNECIYEADRQQFNIAIEMRRVGYHVDKVEQARQSAVQDARLQYMRAQLATEFAPLEAKWKVAQAEYLAQDKRKKDPESYVDRVALRLAELSDRETKPTDVGFLKTKAKADVVALFQILHIPITSYTPKGKPVTDKDAMERAAGRHPLMRRLMHLNDAIVIKSSFIDGLPVKENGRVHPDWTPKITGRWGAGKAQNTPKYVSGWPPEKNPDGSFKMKKSGDLITPRENPRAIVAAPAGRALFGADFSQIELRIAGFVAKDDFVLDVFRRGADPHAEFAREIFPEFVTAEVKFAELAKGTKLKPKSDLTDVDPSLRAQLLPHANAWGRLRDLTKRVEYCGIYGGGAETVYESIVKDHPTVQLASLQQMINIINTKMAGVVKWRRQQETRARVDREIREILLGRCRLFPLGNFNPSIVYNFPIQAFSASLLALALFRFTALTKPHLLDFASLYRFGLLDAAWVKEQKQKGFDNWRGSVDLILNGHDSLTGECDEAEAPRAAAFLEAAMTQTLDLDGEGFTFPAEASFGHRWSEV